MAQIKSLIEGLNNNIPLLKTIINWMFVSFPNLYIETLSLNEMILEGQVFGKIIGFNSGHESEALVMEATPFFFF